MRIDRLHLKNFRCFSDASFDWSPQFNLIAGKNATGKTTLLEGLAIAMGSWLLGFPEYDSRHVWPGVVRIEERSEEGSITLHPQYPVVIAAAGTVDGETGEWRRELRSRAGRTTTRDAGFVKSRAEQALQAVRTGGEPLLPLLSYYGTCRL